MHSPATTVTTTCCAACGKVESKEINLRLCGACKLVKYCNKECLLAHRPQHKIACKKRVAELHDAKLFNKYPPPPEDCPKCFLPLPINESQSSFRSCCGNRICNGCIFVMIDEEDKKGQTKEGARSCPFCKQVTATLEGEAERLNKLVESSNAGACNQLAVLYSNEEFGGQMGVPQDYVRANELYLRAGELGCAVAYFNVGNSYRLGRGVDINMKKAREYYELAAMGGCASARHILACFEGQVGNEQRAYKHIIIAAKSGHDSSLNKVKEGFVEGLIAKDEYAQTLRDYQKRKDEMKSEMRDKASLHKATLEFCG
jgi:hypothetical protein